MTREKKDTAFKYVFWGILCLIFIAFAAQIMWVVFGGFRSFPHFLGFQTHDMWIYGSGSNWRLLTIAAPTIVCLVIWFGIVAPLVFRDAKKHGMDPYLWTSVAVFIPFFLGIIVYLVVRSNGRTTCDKCGEAIQTEYKICPYCGHHRDLLCPQCSKPISVEWKVCPNCEHKLVPGT